MDVYCILCGMSCYKPDPGTTSRSFENELEWTQRHTILTWFDEIIHGCIGGCGIDFSFHNQDYSIVNPTPFDPFSIPGIYVHSDCWFYVYQTYNIAACCSMLSIRKLFEKNVYQQVSYLNYGEIEDYYDQIMNYEQLIQDKKQYLVKSPFKEKRTRDRIHDVLWQIQKHELCLLVYQEGDIKVKTNTGNFFSFWKKQHGEWKQVPGKTTKFTISMRSRNDPRLLNLKFIPPVAWWSRKPIFILDYRTSLDKKKIQVDILCLEKHKSAVRRLLVSGLKT